MVTIDVLWDIEHDRCGGGAAAALSRAVSYEIEPDQHTLCIREITNDVPYRHRQLSD